MSEDSLSVVTEHGAFFDAFESLVERAEEEILLAAPRQRLDLLADLLRDAHDRSVMVLLLVFDLESDEPPQPERYRGLASAVRFVHLGVTPFLCIVDHRRGLSGNWRILVDDSHETKATAFESSNLAYNIANLFLGNFWLQAEEIHVKEWPSLPKEYDDFTAATAHAAALLRDGVPVDARARVTPTNDDDSPERTLAGRLDAARQNIIYPATSGSPAEETLVLDRGDEVVTLGGEGAIVEDFECHSVVFERRE